MGTAVTVFMFAGINGINNRSPMTSNVRYVIRAQFLRAAILKVRNPIKPKVPATSIAHSAGSDTLFDVPTKLSTTPTQRTAMLDHSIVMAIETLLGFTKLAHRTGLLLFLYPLLI